MHPADYERLKMVVSGRPFGAREGRLLASVTRPPTRIVPIEDGDVLPALGGLRVVHTRATPRAASASTRRGPHPVHWGCAADQARACLFASPIFSDDHAAARAIIRRLADLDVAMIVFSHYPPMADGAPTRPRRPSPARPGTEPA